MSAATLLLPPAARLGRQRFADGVLAALGRADRARHADSDRRAQLLRHFDLSPPGWPPAALTRQADAGDAGSFCWLRADPAYVRPDINGARLMAHGEALALDDDDVAAFLPALQPLFDEVGIVLDAPTASHWYLRLPRESALPAFTDPAEALGEDLFDHLVAGESGRRWRALLSEAQVVLHNHPWNARRAASGKPPVNAVWFWGGGVAPDAVHALHMVTCSDEEIARAFAHAAGAVEPLPTRFTGRPGDVVFDLSTVYDPSMLASAWLQPGLAAVRSGAVRRLRLDFADGDVFEIERRQRWRFWRKPFPALHA